MKRALPVFLLALLAALPTAGALAKVAPSSTANTTVTATSGIGQFIDLNALNSAQQHLASSAKQTGFFSSVKGVWDNMNNWLKKNIGLNLKDVILFFATILLWVLGFVVKALEALIHVIEAVLSYVQ